MFVYLNRVYTVGGKVMLCEIVTFDMSDFTITSHIQNLIATKKLISKFSEDRRNSIECITPRGEFLISDRVRVDECTYEELPKVGKYESQFIMSVYDLYSTMLHNGCIYQDSEFPYENGYIGAVTYFDNLRISEDSMSITIDIIKDGKVCASRDLISHNESMTQNEFRFLVPVQRVDKFLKFGVSFIENIEINYEKYAVMEYDCSLSIYSAPNGKFIFPEGAIVKLVMDEYEILVTQKIIDAFIRVNLGKDKFPKVKINPNTPLNYTSMFNDKNGVFFHHKLEIPNDEFFDALASRVLIVTKDLMNRNLTGTKRSRNEIKDWFGDFCINDKMVNAIYKSMLIVEEGNLIRNSVGLDYQAMELNARLGTIRVILFRLRANLFLRSEDTIKSVGGIISELNNRTSTISMEVWV